MNASKVQCRIDEDGEGRVSVGPPHRVFKSVAEEEVDFPLIRGRKTTRLTK